MMTTMRTACYARYSSDLQRATSIDDQVTVARAYAEKQGWTVLGWALVALWAMSSRRHHHHAIRKRSRAPEPDQDPEIAQANAEFRRPATVIGSRTMVRRNVITSPDGTAAAPYKAALEEEYAPEWRHFSPRSVTEYD